MTYDHLEPNPIKLPVDYSLCTLHLYAFYHRHVFYVYESTLCHVASIDPTRLERCWFLRQRAKNVDPRLQSQKQVNNIQLFFTK